MIRANQLRMVPMLRGETRVSEQELTDEALSIGMRYT